VRGQWILAYICHRSLKGETLQILNPLKCERLAETSSERRVKEVYQNLLLLPMFAFGVNDPRQMPSHSSDLVGHV
jgi:hypothetical protein